MWERENKNSNTKRSPLKDKWKIGIYLDQCRQRVDVLMLVLSYIFFVTVHRKYYSWEFMPTSFSYTRTGTKRTKRNGAKQKSRKNVHTCNVLKQSARVTKKNKRYCRCIVYSFKFFILKTAIIYFFFTSGFFCCCFETCLFLRAFSTLFFICKFCMQEIFFFVQWVHGCETYNKYFYPSRFALNLNSQH